MKGRGRLSRENGPLVKIVPSHSKLSVPLCQTQKYREPPFPTHSDDKNWSRFTQQFHTQNMSLFTLSHPFPPQRAWKFDLYYNLSGVTFYALQLCQRNYVS